MYLQQCDLGRSYAVDPACLRQCSGHNFFQFHTGFVTKSGNGTVIQFAGDLPAFQCPEMTDSDRFLTQIALIMGTDHQLPQHTAFQWIFPIVTQIGKGDDGRIDRFKSAVAVLQQIPAASAAGDVFCFEGFFQFGTAVGLGFELTVFVFRQDAPVVGFF